MYRSRGTPDMAQIKVSQWQQRLLQRKERFPGGNSSPDSRLRKNHCQQGRRAAAFPLFLLSPHLQCWNGSGLVRFQSAPDPAFQHHKQTVSSIVFVLIKGKTFSRETLNLV